MHFGSIGRIERRIRGSPAQSAAGPQWIGRSRRILGAHKTTNGDIGGRGHPAGDDRRYSGSHQRYAGQQEVIEIFRPCVTSLS
ncbi:hypothetical protein GCM10017567_00540 [Amycolatopsis bullii]|uniref:Uncharacterized protein n=1 Tax=Amycolatopsis bullii TaxID=941987 RepID=A0ABQ3JUY4_9PSEU|nr:hypothetical protein GCM10017567_00540 [Amycolatopsis bullii]